MANPSADTPEPQKSLGEHLRESQEERDGMRPANDHYTGEPCQLCGRIRVMLLRNGKLQCEKCEFIQEPPADTLVTEPPLTRGND